MRHRRKEAVTQLIHYLGILVNHIRYLGILHWAQIKRPSEGPKYRHCQGSFPATVTAPDATKISRKAKERINIRIHQLQFLHSVSFLC